MTELLAVVAAAALFAAFGLLSRVFGCPGGEGCAGAGPGRGCGTCRRRTKEADHD